MKKFCTHYKFGNGEPYPAMTILWEEDDSWACGGFKGTLSMWLSGSEKDPHEHTVRIGQGSPIGRVYVTFDDFSHGAWRFTSFEGVGVTERDLQWATLWAAEALRSRRALGDLDPIPNT